MSVADVESGIVMRITDMTVQIFFGIKIITSSRGCVRRLIRAKNSPDYINHIIMIIVRQLFDFI